MAIITVLELQDYLGVDENSTVEIELARNSALEYLKRSTGIDWEKVQNNSYASETVQAIVYLNFYGIRDDAKNTVFLEQYIEKHICQLQLSEEAFSDGKV